MRLSLFFDRQWDEWPVDAYSELARWRDRGTARAVVSIGSADMPARVDKLAAIETRLAT